MNGTPTFSTDQLRREIGDDLFAVLCSAGNVTLVREFAKTLIEPDLIIGDRTYKSIPFLREGEDILDIDTLTARAIELSANLGEDDGKYILEHEDEIPCGLAGKEAWVFPAWRDDGNPTYVGWDGEWFPTLCCYWCEANRIQKNSWHAAKLRLLRRMS